MTTRIIILMLSLSCVSAQAQSPIGFPTELFGIEPGRSYTYSQNEDYSNEATVFPVTRFISATESVHYGASLYFEPRDEHKAFPFSELNTPGTFNSEARYRIFVFPVIPDETNNLEELRTHELPQTVTMIEWSQQDSRITEETAYAWARNLCVAIEAEFAITPDSTDLIDNNLYRCKFTSNERELEISSILGQTIQLSLADPIETALSSDVHLVLNGLEKQIPAGLLRDANEKLSTRR